MCVYIVYSTADAHLAAIATQTQTQSQPTQTSTGGVDGATGTDPDLSAEDMDDYEPEVTPKGSKGEKQLFFINCF